MNETAFKQQALQDILRNTREQVARCSAQVGDQQTRSVDLLSQPLTDTGNAERLVALHGSDIRYCAAERRWYVWDGRRWRKDDTGRANVLAQKTMRTAYLQSPKLESKEAREKADSFFRRSENAKGLRDMVACAAYQPAVVIRPHELDSHRYLLNCADGTLDLKTGELRPHERTDLITKLVHVNYNPDAKCPTFLRFAHSLFEVGPEADEQVAERSGRHVGFLQRALGLALTGDVSEKVAFCLIGPPNTGKTTLLETIRTVIPEYSAQVMVESLMRTGKHESNTALADIADLRGARFVTTSEASEGQRLAEAKVKYLTSGTGRIKTARKYENPTEFAATHKLFFDSNFKPDVRSNDDAIWDRLRLIPFENTIPKSERDPRLREKFAAEYEGILAWMVTGCRQWLDNGLGTIAELDSAREQWRQETDPLQDFLDDCCQFAPNLSCPTADLRKAYENWCNENGQKPSASQKQMADRLSRAGCTSDRRRIDGHQRRVWIGIDLSSVTP